VTIQQRSFLRLIDGRADRGGGDLSGVGFAIAALGIVSTRTSGLRGASKDPVAQPGWRARSAESLSNQRSIQPSEPRVGTVAIATSSCPRGILRGSGAEALADCNSELQFSFSLNAISLLAIILVNPPLDASAEKEAM
jgi:hypothetical protein